MRYTINSTYFERNGGKNENKKIAQHSIDIIIGCNNDANAIIWLLKGAGNTNI